MLKSDQNIDKIFKDGLEDLRVEPSRDLWSGIESGLESGTSRRNKILFWRVAAAASIFIAGLLSWLFIGDNITDASRVAVIHAVPDVELSLEEVAQGTAAFVEDEINSQPKDNWPVKNTYKSGKINGTLKKESHVKLATSGLSAGSEKHFGKPVLPLEGLSEINLLSSIPELSVQLVQAQSNKSYYPLYAYEEHHSKKNKLRMLVGGSMSSSYSYRESSGANATYVSSNYSESGISTIGGGVNVRFERGTRWSIETGVLFAQLGQEVSNKQKYNSNKVYGDSYSAVNVVTSELSNSMGSISFDEQSTIPYEKALSQVGMNLANQSSVTSNAGGLRQTLEYVEVPLMARYKVLDGFPILSVAGGLSSNFLVGNTAYLLKEGNSIDVGETENIKPFSWSSSLGLGVELPVSKLVRINVEPRVKYYLESISSNPDYNFQPYSFAVFGGVTFILK